MSKKILITIGSILVIVILAIAVFLFIKQNNQIINNQPFQQATKWKSYKNNDYGFELKYPGDWKMEIANNTGFDAILNPPSFYECQKNCTGDGECPCGHIALRLIDNPDGLDLVTFWKEKNGWQENVSWKDLKEVVVGRKRAYRFTAISGFDGSDGRALVIMLDGKILQINESYLNELESNIFNQIIATLKLD